MNRAMVLSFGVAFFLLLLKTFAYLQTDSIAVLSDVAESVIHLIGIAFCIYSMRLAVKPPDANHTYGHDRITFFSTAIEGTAILGAGGYIIYRALEACLEGTRVTEADQGAFYLLLAAGVNSVLGTYLWREGRRHHALILQAHAKHVFVDAITSAGVALSLFLTKMELKWPYTDPLIAFLIGCNILWMGRKLLREAVQGLMDGIDPRLQQKIASFLDSEAKSYHIEYHGLRHRNSGSRLLIEVHLLFPAELTIARAHEIATEIERKMENTFLRPLELTTHLEPIEGHDEIHAKVLGRKG